MVEQLVLLMVGSANAPEAIWDTMDDEGSDEFDYALPLELAGMGFAQLQDRFSSELRIRWLCGCTVGAGWRPPFYILVGDNDEQWFMLSDGLFLPFQEALKVALARKEWIITPDANDSTIFENTNTLESHCSIASHDARLSFAHRDRGPEAVEMESC
jgi:hypothetical protein